MAQLKPILLVEDDPKDVELTLEALGARKLANEVVVLRDGAEALDHLFRRGAHAGREPGDPVVVILDIRMPRVDGLEVLRAIRDDERTRRIPVVMLTSSPEEADFLSSHRLGVNAFVTKPVGAREFAAAIQDIGVFWAILNVPPPG